MVVLFIHFLYLSLSSKYYFCIFQHIHIHIDAMYAFFHIDEKSLPLAEMRNWYVRKYPQGKRERFINYSTSMQLTFITISWMKYLLILHTYITFSHSVILENVPFTDTSSINKPFLILLFFLIEKFSYHFHFWFMKKKAKTFSSFWHWGKWEERLIILARVRQIRYEWFCFWKKKTQIWWKFWR